MLTGHPDSVLKAVNIASGAGHSATGRPFTGTGTIAAGEVIETAKLAVCSNFGATVR